MIIYSIIQKSQLEGASRLDAEYYQLEHLENYRVLNGLATRRLGDFCRISDGDHAKIPGFVDSDGVRYLRAKDLQYYFVDDSDPVFVSKPYFQKLKRSHIKPYDIVLSIMGTVGNLAVVLPEYGIITANRAVSIISPKSKDFSSFFIAIYLETKYGVSQRKRESMGGVQQRVNLDDLSSIKIPVVPPKQQEMVDEIFNQALDQYNSSKRYYREAEELLLQELGLADFQIPEDLAFEVNFSEVKNAGRTDADYFQPKYNALISKIRNKNCLSFFDLIKDYSTGYTFKSENYQEGGVPLIRINNIKKGYLDLTDTAYLTEKDYLLSPKDTARPGDAVLSMSGTVGACTLIPPDIPKSSINQRILRFRSKNINADYLVLLLNSIVGQYQLERIGTGGVQTNISYNDIRNILIPILPQPVQEKIADLVRKSHEARKKSKELLTEAKRKVEEMIEKGI